MDGVAAGSATVAGTNHIVITTSYWQYLPIAEV